jgi:hypothetical protein
MDKIIGGWRKLHKEELHNMHSSPNRIRMIKSRRMRWAGHIACLGRRGMHTEFLVEKPEGKKPLRRLRRRWKDNIKMAIRDIGWGGTESIPLVQCRD